MQNAYVTTNMSNPVYCKVPTWRVSRHVCMLLMINCIPDVCNPLFLAPRKWKRLYSIAGFSLGATPSNITSANFYLVKMLSKPKGNYRPDSVWWVSCCTCVQSISERQSSRSSRAIWWFDRVSTAGKNKYHETTGRFLKTVDEQKNNKKCKKHRLGFKKLVNAIVAGHWF